MLSVGVGPVFQQLKDVERRKVLETIQMHQERLTTETSDLILHL